MPAFVANPGPFYWNNPRKRNGGGMFHPSGPMQRHGAHPNPGLWSSKTTRAARIIVGFNVGGEPKWTLDDLIPIVKRVRTEQVGNPSSSFIAQRGVYQHHSGQIVTEDGAQVIIIDTFGTAKQKFERQMVELAEIVCRELQQDEAIVEIQKNGISEKTIGVGP